MRFKGWRCELPSLHGFWGLVKCLNNLQRSFITLTIYRYSPAEPIVTNDHRTPLPFPWRPSVLCNGPRRHPSTYNSLSVRCFGTTLPFKLSFTCRGLESEVSRLKYLQDPIGLVKLETKQKGTVHTWVGTKKKSENYFRQFNSNLYRDRVIFSNFFVPTQMY